MFKIGTILYFTPFYFKNGNKERNKYFIVLGKKGEDYIIASLPTKVDKTPSSITKEHGSINEEDRCFNCYYFEPNKIICDSGFSFDLPTYLYGNEVEDYSISTFIKVYPIEGRDYSIKGELKSNELTALIDCLKNSGSVKRGIKKFL